ncbi:MAG: endonuclease V [Thermoproteota archaeon]
MNRLAFTVEKAFYAQQRMSKLVSVKTPHGLNVERVAGVDVGYGDAEERGVVASAVLDLNDMKILETVRLKVEVKVPYIPGLLGFREAPLMVKALSSLKSSFDVALIDGHGVAHPRRFGLACHVGVLLDKPSVGVAKSHLHGDICEGEVFDECGHRIGRVMDLGKHKVYVSVGHKISLDDAVQVVHRCVIDGVVKPLKEAHEASIKAWSGERC